MIYSRSDWLVEPMLLRAMLLVVVLLCSQSIGADSPANGPGMKVATCPFPVSGDVDENARYIKDFIRKAAANKADVVHFSEAALSGYAGVDVPDFGNYDCFPEMYNVYRHQGVEVMFHSFYNARHMGKTVLDEIIPAEIRVRASDNLMWVIANNESSGT